MWKKYVYNTLGALSFMYKYNLGYANNTPVIKLIGKSLCTVCFYFCRNKLVWQYEILWPELAIFVSHFWSLEQRS